MKNRFIFLIIFFSVFNTNLFAQGEGNIWYFGLNAGIDFSNGNAVAITNGALNASEGCATISNELGKQVYQVSENQKKGKHNLKWNANSYPDGVYALRLMVGQRIYTRKLMKVR